MCVQLHRIRCGYLNSRVHVTETVWWWHVADTPWPTWCAPEPCQQTRSLLPASELVDQTSCFRDSLRSPVQRDKHQQTQPLANKLSRKTAIAGTKRKPAFTNRSGPELKLVRSYLTSLTSESKEFELSAWTRFFNIKGLWLTFSYIFTIVIMYL